MHLVVNLAIDPIAHRPPGRLAHRPNVSGFDHNRREASTLQPFDSTAISTPRSASSAMASAIYDAYPLPPFHPQPSNHSDHVFSDSTLDPAALTPEPPASQHPDHEGLDYAMGCHKRWHPGAQALASSPGEYSLCCELWSGIHALIKPLLHLSLSTTWHGHGLDRNDRPMRRNIQYSHQRPRGPTSRGRPAKRTRI
jgi:hypothetical protein